MVTKINLTTSDSKQKATNVQLKSPNGTQLTANLKAGGEVILSAGVVRTPQLLELSGIGDSAVLTPLGIPVKVDLPGVGANYEDQLVFEFSFVHSLTSVRTLTILTYELKEGILSFDALGYNATLATEVTCSLL
jgi:choline dehydrogenase-like flavoprotein